VDIGERKIKGDIDIDELVYGGSKVNRDDLDKECDIEEEEEDDNEDMSDEEEEENEEGVAVEDLDESEIEDDMENDMSGP